MKVLLLTATLGVSIAAAAGLATSSDRSAVSASSQPSLSCGPTLCFSGVFSHNAVLQRGPEAAALFGSVPASAPAGAPLSLTLAASDGSYTKTFGTTAAADRTWKVLLDPMLPEAGGGDFKATVSCPTCGGASTSATLIGLTFGDVITCNGQSNMVLGLFNTFERNDTLAAVRSGVYKNKIRTWSGGLGRNVVEEGNWVIPAGPNLTDCSTANAGQLTNGQWCTAEMLAASSGATNDQNALFDQMAVCFYTFQWLTDSIVAAGGTPPPFGLVQTAIGGTMIEEWTPWQTQIDSGCVNVTCLCYSQGCNSSQPLGPNCTGALGNNGGLYHGQVEPHINVTIRLAIYFQGENNCGTNAGSALYGSGYGCLLPRMLAAWRAAWSATAGTTNALFPVGIVTIHDGGDEGNGRNLAAIRWAQSGNAGSLPSPEMPNTFIAHGFDAGDPAECYFCYGLGGDPKQDLCCVDEYMPLGSNCIGDHRGEIWSHNKTKCAQGAGTLHPRSKGILAHRLAQSAFSLYYGGAAQGWLSQGPVISGCSLSADNSKLTLIFNRTLLGAESVVVKQTPGVAPLNASLENTALYVLVNSTLPDDLAMNYMRTYKEVGGSYQGPFSDGNEFDRRGWVPVVPVANGDNTVSIDLARLGGLVPTAVRYAEGAGGCWDGDPVNGGSECNRMCTGPYVDCSRQPCPTGACPLYASGKGSLLPAAPFVANIVGGRCACLPPQICDESLA